MEEVNTDIYFGTVTGNVPDDVSVEEVADAFDVLGDPIRLRILLALAGTRRASWRHDGLPYSELRQAVDVEDGGRFNYHLDRLRGEFVRKDDDRYWLTGDGARIVDVVFGGSFGRFVERERAPIDTPAPSGDAPLEAGFYDGYLAVWEPDGEEPIWDMALAPNAAVERRLDELVDLASLAARQYTELALAGTCPECWAPIERTIRSGDESIGFACDRCRTAFELPYWACAAAHPVVGSMLEANGFDQDEMRTWRTLATSTEVRGQDPVEVTLSVGDDRRTVRIPSDGPVTAEIEDALDENQLGDSSPTGSE